MTSYDQQYYQLLVQMLKHNHCHHHHHYSGIKTDLFSGIEILQTRCHSSRTSRWRSCRYSDPSWRSGTLRSHTDHGSHVQHRRPGTAADLATDLRHTSREGCACSPRMTSYSSTSATVEMADVLGVGKYLYKPRHLFLFVYYSILFTSCTYFVYCIFVYFVYSSIQPLAVILQ